MAVAFVATLCVFASCNHNNANISRQQARDLFVKSKSLLTAYSDSLKSAKDSAQVLGLVHHADSLITKLNFEYPVDTDLSISESENDTLINLTSRIIQMRDSLLHRFSLPPDTTEMTCISQDLQSNSNSKV